ncbi:MAG: putative ATPase [Candidatus Tokpelaia sp. JSC161]|nr:MAG: putative ATPase [Candidatus Tokpelaia sp. JSC161]
MGRIQLRYNELVKAGKISSDSVQISAISYYDRLLQVIEQRSARNNLFSRFFKREQNSLIKGFYFYGKAGCGKTMLMDLFFSCLPDSGKRRVHFNDFMNDVYERMNRYRSLGKDNSFYDLSTVLAKEASILCFDEFAVTDIADGMILSRLFSMLFQKGVIVILTSNVAPAELYRDGFNRELFSPFIKILNKNLEIIHLDKITDYRLEKKPFHKAIYMVPLCEESDTDMDSAWREICCGFEEKDVEINLRGHVLNVPRASVSAARFNFSDLCCKPLSVFDYRVLVSRYRTFFIDGIPILDDFLRNETKRFILLIDTFYIHHVRLVISANALPDKLYQGCTGSTESFEFERTVSRLFEMQSKDYLRSWLDKSEENESV